MINRFVVALALAVALGASHGAFAFQEQKGSTPPPAEAAPAPADTAPSADAKAGVTEEAAPKPETGTEIRIPGLGKLGVLPKMDFGLELLYGAAENQPAGQPEGAKPEDDLTVRGSVKHRF